MPSGPRSTTVTKGSQDKTDIDFDFVFTVGGDGTLLRLLRILFTRCQPAMLPKIITLSMGSINYLSNFQISAYKKILEATVLNLDQARISDALKIDYRSRLQCLIGTKDQ